MESKRKTKLLEANKQLEAAIEQYNTKPTDIGFLSLSKAFEIAVEYAWRELKSYVEDQGLDAPSPKMTIKQAAKLSAITEPESWLDCIDARNDSVHNYFGISKEEYIQLAKKFLLLVNKMKSEMG